MGEQVETLKHRKKESTFKWFILGFIPIITLYVAWKVAELLSGHEKIIKPKEQVE